MSALNKWVKVQAAIGALGTAVPLNSVSKANPGVAAYTGTDPNTGDLLAFTDIVGMYQIDNRVIRASGVDGTGNTFNLEGQDTTLYDTFVSGNFQPITWGSNFTTVIDFGAGGGEFDTLDATTAHDALRKVLPNMGAAPVFNMVSQWKPDDAALAAALAASEAQSLVALRVVFATGYRFALLGYFGTILLPTGATGQLVQTPVLFTGAARQTNYAT
jgi:hypothetical protein